jgi:hypothetical protein
MRAVATRRPAAQRACLKIGSIGDDDDDHDDHDDHATRR